MSYFLLIPTILVAVAALGALVVSIVVWFRTRKRPDYKVSVRSGDKLVEVHADSVDPTELQILLKIVELLEKRTASDVDQAPIGAVGKSDTVNTTDPSADSAGPQSDQNNP